MSTSTDAPAIEIEPWYAASAATDAVDGLSLRVEPGRCYGFFGRNGAGKTTTIKCLLNLLRPTSGTVRMFGMDPARDEVAVKSRLAYVPGRGRLLSVDDRARHARLLRVVPAAVESRDRAVRCSISSGSTRGQKTSHLSKGQRTQLALIAAICPEPELLVLDEPTSGLDPIVRREFIQTVIGAYQDGDPRPAHRVRLDAPHRRVRRADRSSSRSSRAVATC